MPSENFSLKPRSFKNRVFSLSIFNRVIFLLIVVSAASCFIIINDLSTRGFKIKELKNQISQLTSDNEDNELKVMSLSSYNNITSRVQTLDMVAADSVDYLSANETLVAKR